MAPPEYVQIVGQEQPAPLPVAWLEGDVLAEYLQFLKEVEEAAAAPLTGVKWLEGDVLANFLQFLEEDESVVHYGSGNSSSGSNDGDFMCEEDQDEEEEEMEHLLRHITSLPAFMARAAAAASVQD
ncbi:hypothetical protein D1007_17003 [Hordeum vulgare]|uniref:Uncharacterized protein n=1 Tax=Hordeum vulgare subsp. vulgare TaxID=112509 RepID=M0ZAW0_HORVV|nr:hypothetical protein D1007_17003 [Hordeum vulgare]KAI4974695.1 hypothetical protein ZWY2020_048302 [Hordeum vulgare]